MPAGRPQQRSTPPTHALGVPLYGALAIAYHQKGMTVDWDTLLAVAAAECIRMEASLKTVSVENEPNPAKMNWNC